MRKNRDLLAAILLSVGVITKISPAIILLYAAYKKRFNVVVYSFVILATLSLMAEILVRPGINFYYVRHVLDDVSRQSNGLGWTDQSVMAFFKRANLFSSMGNFLASYALVGVIFILFFYLDLKLGYRPKEINVYDYFFLVNLAVVGTGLTWFHQYTMLYPSLVVIFSSALLFKRPASYTLIILTFVCYFLWFFDLKENIKWYSAGFLNLNMLIGAFITLGILFYLKKSRKPIATDLGTEGFNLPFYVKPIFLSMVIFSPLLLRTEFFMIRRDIARKQEIGYMSKYIAKASPRFVIGNSDSVKRSNKLDEGYVLFQKGEDAKVRQRISILFRDPINSPVHNCFFESPDGVCFRLGAVMESRYFKKKYNGIYEVWANCD